MLLDRKYHILISIVGVFLSFQRMYSQIPSYRHFTDDDGLPSMTIYGIRQDPNGFLWMTTTKGICRFDGYEFKKYEVPDLKGQDIPFLFMDSKGIPWFYNLAGEVIYIRNDSILIAHIQKPQQQIAINSFYVFNDLLYITWKYPDNFETICYDTHDFSKSKILYTPLGINGVYNDQLIGNDLNTRVSNFRLYSVLDQKLLLDIPLHSNDNFNYHSEINLLSAISKDSVLILSPYFCGLINSQYQLKTPIVFRDILKDTVLFVSLINSSELFIKTNYNSYIYNLRNNSFTKDSLIGISINTIFEDRDQRKWISTTNKGLYLKGKGNKELYLNSNSGIFSNEIIRITEDYPNLFIHHTNGAISVLNLITNTWFTIQIPGSRRIKSLIKNNNKQYFAGTDNGLYLINLQSDNRYSIELMKLASIKDLLWDKNYGLFILNNTGTFICNENELHDKEYKFLVDKAAIKTRSTSIIKFNENILAGTVNGIYILKDQKFEKWNALAAHDLYINRLYKQNDQILWICTDGNGAYAFQNGDIVDSVTIKNGLPSNSVSSIAAIDDQRVVIGTDNGAFVYDLSKHEGFGFNQLDGLPGKEILDIHCTQGKVWFGGVKGLVSVPIEELKQNSEKPLVSIISASVFSKGGETEFKYDLPYYSNHLRFRLQTRSLLSKDQLKIFYKLNATDSSWIMTNTKVLEFVGLAPGKYDLQIKAVNEDGVSSEKPVLISFVIHPAWWKTFWFNSVLIGSLILSSIGITYWRQSRRRTEEERKRKIVDQMNQLRQQALQNQMNPHFIFNALNAIQSFLLVNDEVKAVNYLSKFGKLIRMIFEQSKLKNISLQDEIDLLKHYIHLEELRFGHKVKVHFTIDPELMELAPDILIPPLLIQPIIENAFRHGLFHLEKNGLLSIHIYRKDSNLICSIEDNGIGREESERINKWKNSTHKSSGIKSTLERLAILDQGRNKLGLEIIDLFDQNGKPAGTKAILTL